MNVDLLKSIAIQILPIIADQLVKHLKADKKEA